MTARDDLGHADPAVEGALADFSRDGGPASRARVHAALLSARLLVPVVPIPEAEETVTARARLVGADGRYAVPAFTSVAALGRWRADARPVPVPAVEVFESAQVAGEAVVVDVAGPVAFVLTGAALRALAAGFVPVGGDESLSTRAAGGLSVVAAPTGTPAGLDRALNQALAGEPAVREAYLLAPEAGPDPSDLAVGLVLAAPLDPADLVTLVRRVADRLGRSGSLAAGLDIAVLDPAQRRAAARVTRPVFPV